MKFSLQFALIPTLFFLSACTKSASRKNQQNSTSQIGAQQNQAPQNPDDILISTREKRDQSNRRPPGTQPAKNETKNGSNSTEQSETGSEVATGSIRNIPAGPGAPASLPNGNSAGVPSVRIQEPPQAAASANQQTQVPQGAMTQARTKAQNSDEIRKQEIVKLSFQDLSGLQTIEKKEGFVLYKSQMLDQKSALQKLLQANEEHFCTVKGSEQFHSDDYLRIETGDNKALDEKNGIYQTTLTFENSNGQLSLVCTHTTSSLFLEDVRINFKNYIKFVDFEGRTENPPDYVNPRTEDRLLKAVQIQDLEKFKKIVVQANAKENFAMTKGEIKGIEVSINAVQAQKESMTCYVHEVLGSLDTQKIFVQVETGIGEDTPSEIPTAGIYHMYLADPDNGFILYCMQAKKAPLKELFSAMKGVFKFGVLERKEYRKKREELVRIHKERTQAPAAK